MSELKNEGASASVTPGRPTQQRLGPLRCVVVDGFPTPAHPKPTIPVILCHGYGAPGDDLVGLVMPLLEGLADHSGAFRFVFPEASRGLGELGWPEGRAWWPLNMASLQQKLATRRFDELHPLIPPGLDEAREQLTQTLAAVFAAMPGDQSSSTVPTYVLGGFSQGAMLTMDTALRGPAPPPKVLVQFSGTLICQGEWEASRSRLKESVVLQTHGRVDPILPIGSAEALRDLLIEGDVDVRYVEFQGPHTIESRGLRQLLAGLVELAEGADSGPAIP